MQALCDTLSSTKGLIENVLPVPTAYVLAHGFSACLFVVNPVHACAYTAGAMAAKVVGEAFFNDQPDQVKNLFTTTASILAFVAVGGTVGLTTVIPAAVVCYSSQAICGIASKLLQSSVVNRSAILNTLKIQAVKDFVSANIDEALVIPATLAASYVCNITLFAIDPLSATAFAATVVVADVIASSTFNNLGAKAAFSTVVPFAAALFVGSTPTTAATYYLVTIISACFVDIYIVHNQPKYPQYF